MEELIYEENEIRGEVHKQMGWGTIWVVPEWLAAGKWLTIERGNVVVATKISFGSRQSHILIAEKAASINNGNFNLCGKDAEKYCFVWPKEGSTAEIAENIAQTIKMFDAALEAVSNVDIIKVETEAGELAIARLKTVADYKKKGISFNNQPKISKEMLAKFNERSEYI